MTHTAFVADRTMEYMRQNRDKHFLCIAGFYSPHSPWVAPQEFLDLYEPDKLTLPEFPSEVDARRSESSFSDSELRSARHGYYAMVSELDYHIGRILGCLDECGLTENTVVIFTSDHGEWLGEHLRYGKGLPARDCISRVPLIMRWPEGIRFPGRTVTGIVEGVDVVPTLLECIGIPLPYHLQGLSFFEALTERAFTGRESALTEGEGAKSLRTAKYRYVSSADGQELLFDLDTDPHGYLNVANESDYAQALAEVRHQMLRHLMQIEQPLPRTWAY
jgi:arylsulfatase A-like enzyme